jgi:hypothetical protein
MLIFAISINPFLDTLEEKLKSFHHSQQTPKPVLITHADYVTNILRNSAEIQPVREALEAYKAASGARLNILKSKAMALGSWDSRADIMGIPYVTDLHIHGTRMSSTIRASARETWNVVTGHIKNRPRMPTTERSRLTLESTTYRCVSWHEWPKFFLHRPTIFGR